jgi:hypothetical protein
VLKATADVVVTQTDSWIPPAKVSNLNLARAVLLMLAIRYQPAAALDATLSVTDDK